MISEKCGFCSCVLKSIPEIEDHYRDEMLKTTPFSKVILTLLIVILMSLLWRDVIIVKKSFLNLGKRLGKKHLRLIANPNSNLIVRRIGSKYLKFSINFDRHKKFYDFYTPEKVIRQFIEDVALKIPNEEGEFKLISNLMN